MTALTTEPLIADTQIRAVEFAEPLPGFEGEHGFTLTPIDTGGLLMSMRSVRTPGLRFVLTAPEYFFGDYFPDLGPAVGWTFGSDPGELELFVILTIGTGLSDATANLRAPILVSTRTGRAVQIVLDDETLPMRRPLIAH
jgi:flagellar assembly factor FliW